MLSVLQHILPVLDMVGQASRPFVIIAEGIDGEVLAAFTLNKLHCYPHVTAVKDPGFVHNRKSILGDLIIFTGGTFFTDGQLDIKIVCFTGGMLSSTSSMYISKEGVERRRVRKSKSSPAVSKAALSFLTHSYLTLTAPNSRNVSQSFLGTSISRSEAH